MSDKREMKIIQQALTSGGNGGGIRYSSRLQSGAVIFRIPRATPNESEQLVMKELAVA